LARLSNIKAAGGYPTAGLIAVKPKWHFRFVFWEPSMLKRFKVTLFPLFAIQANNETFTTPGRCGIVKNCKIIGCRLSRARQNCDRDTLPAMHLSSTVVKADHRQVHLKEKRPRRRTYRPNNQNNMHRQQVTHDAPKIGGVPFTQLMADRQGRGLTTHD